MTETATKKSVPAWKLHKSSAKPNEIAWYVREGIDVASPSALLPPHADTAVGDWDKTVYPDMDSALASIAGIVFVSDSTHDLEGFKHFVFSPVQERGADFRFHTIGYIRVVMDHDLKRAAEHFAK